MEGVKRFGQNLTTVQREQVQAIQLKSEHDLDNFIEVAQFCGGEARCIYQGKQVEHLAVVVVPGVKEYAVEGDWVYSNGSGGFNVIDDAEFSKMYDTKDHSDMPVLCHYCLSRVESTPLADPGETACPECGVAYQGDRRTEEYNILLAAGLVRVDR